MSRSYTRKADRWCPTLLKQLATLNLKGAIWKFVNSPDIDPRDMQDRKEKYKRIRIRKKK